MHWLVVQRTLGLLLMLFSLAMLPPAAVGWWYGDGAVNAFLQGFVFTLVAGLIVWLPVSRHRGEVRLREGFVIVSLFWLLLGLDGATPLLLAERLHLGFTNAVFEALSGFTTTGATILTGIDELPHAILFYRQELQWLGGMAVIVLALAVLPMLGIGGMQLNRAETPGRFKDAKLAPRVTQTAKGLWYLYLGLTVACALAYLAAGMDPFDAVSHSFATVSTGGFSTHDANMGYFHGPAVQLVAALFMLLAGANFGLHFFAWRRLSPAPYRGDPELRTYLLLLGLITAVTAAYLYAKHTFASPAAAFTAALFQTVSIGTTTGFTLPGYPHWPAFVPMLLLFVSVIGACTGSTGGGMKVLRVLLLFRQGVREVRRLVHPSAQLPIRVGGAPLPDRVVDAVWGFFAIYVAVFALMLLTLLSTGLDQVTAFSAVAACLNNLGPALGSASVDYAGLGDSTKWVLAFAMLLGRLEIFTLLVLFTRAFWRK